MNRFKVIADYPDSPYKIGEVVNDKSYPVNKLSFPDIFEPILWCEGLTEDDLHHLPEYIMINPEIELEPPFHTLKVIKWELIDGNLKATSYKKEEMSHNSLRLYLPSNKIEFAKYLREWKKYTSRDD